MRIMRLKEVIKKGVNIVESLSKLLISLNRQLTKILIKNMGDE